MKRKSEDSMRSKGFKTKVVEFKVGDVVLVLKDSNRKLDRRYVLSRVTKINGNLIEVIRNGKVFMESRFNLVPLNLLEKREC